MGSNNVLPIPTLEFVWIPNWIKAKQAPKIVTRAIREGYDEAAGNFANKYLKKVLSYIGTGKSPKTVMWDPLSPHTRSKTPFYFRKGKLKRSLGIKRNSKNLITVGLVKRGRSSSGGIGLATLLKILEEGDSTGRIPDRPLFEPVYRELGGNRTLRNVIIKAIKSRLMISGIKSSFSNDKLTGDYREVTLL